MPLLHNDTCPMRDYYVWNMYCHDPKEANYFNGGLVEPNPSHSYLWKDARMCYEKSIKTIRNRRTKYCKACFRVLGHAYLYHPTTRIV